MNAVLAATAHKSDEAGVMKFAASALNDARRKHEEAEEKQADEASQLARYGLARDGWPLSLCDRGVCVTKWLGITRAHIYCVGFSREPKQETD